MRKVIKDERGNETDQAKNLVTTRRKVGYLLNLNRDEVFVLS